MDVLKVRWTKLALEQRNHILKYWNNRNKSISYSTKLKVEIKEHTDLLLEKPNAGKIMLGSENVRVFVFGNYSLYYLPTAQHIEVLAFWDNRQNPEKLNELLNK